MNISRFIQNIQDYLHVVNNFINFILHVPKTIISRKNRYLCVKCKNKKFHHIDVMVIHLFKKEFIKKYLCWFAYKELYIHHKTMLEIIIGSTYSYSNRNEFMNDNSNLNKIW